MAYDSKTISCPHCRHVLQVRPYRRVRVKACGQCRGILADRGTIDKLLINTDRLWARPPERHAPKIDCPICSNWMTAIALGDLVLDRCDDDAVIWFDGAELMKLAPTEPTGSDWTAGMGTFLEGLSSLLDGLG